jgi:hypothetical protein
MDEEDHEGIANITLEAIRRWRAESLRVNGPQSFEDLGKNQIKILLRPLQAKGKT